MERESADQERERLRAELEPLIRRHRQLSRYAREAVRPATVATNERLATELGVEIAERELRLAELDLAASEADLTAAAGRVAAAKAELAVLAQQQRLAVLQRNREIREFAVLHNVATSRWEEVAVCTSRLADLHAALSSPRRA